MVGNVCSWIPNVTEFAKLDSTRVLARLERCRTFRKEILFRKETRRRRTETDHSSHAVSRCPDFVSFFFPLPFSSKPFLPFPSCFACVFFLSPTAREKSVRLYWSTLSLAARTVTARRFPCGAPAFLHLTFSTVKNAACIWPGSVLGFRLSLHYVRDTLIP